MIMSAWREFLTTGRLGQIKAGLAPEQVEAVLGPPDDRSVKRKPVHLLRYGGVEFAFRAIPGSRESKLASIAIYFHPPGREIPEKLRPSDRGLSHGASAADIHQLLDSAALSACSTIDGEQEYLTLDSGASIVLINGRLHSVHFKAAEKEPERKQITVSLPEETVQKLKHRAAVEQLSVPNLIEKMIKAAC